MIGFLSLFLYAKFTTVCIYIYVCVYVYIYIIYK